jgi:hypothetical protein
MDKKSIKRPLDVVEAKDRISILVKEVKVLSSKLKSAEVRIRRLEDAVKIQTD